jgi:hypothetical protein
LVSLASGNGHSTPTNKKRGYKKRGKATYGHKHFDKQDINNVNINQDMPFYLLQDRNTLDMQEFEIAIDCWMNYFKFSYATEELYAYDEGIHPDEQSKPSGRRYKYNAKSNNTPEQRNHALVYACQTLVEYSRYQRLSTPIVTAAHRQATSDRDNIHYNNRRHFDLFSSTKYQPNTFTKCPKYGTQAQSKGPQHLCNGHQQELQKIQRSSENSRNKTKTPQNLATYQSTHTNHGQARWKCPDETLSHMETPKPPKGGSPLIKNLNTCTCP